MKSSLFVLIILCGSLLSVTASPVISSTLEQVNIGDTWDESKGEDVTIAVIDSGILWEGKLSKTNRWKNSAELNGENGTDDDNNGYVDDFYGIDLVDFDSDPSTDQGSSLSNFHGTWIANILASSHGENALSIAPEVNIQNIRILDNDGFGLLSSLEEGINYAIDTSVDIISLSLLIDVQIQDSLISTIQRAIKEGIVIVAPRYNFGTGMFNGTQASGMIGVEHLEIDRSSKDTISHPTYTVSAPTIDIETYYPDGTSKKVTGISFAVPLVAGTLALMRSIDPDRDTRYLPDVLNYSSTKVSESRSGNRSLLNVYDSVMNWKNFATIDFDGDGVLSGEEVRLGANPFDETSSRRELQYQNFITITSFVCLVFLLRLKYRRRL